MRRTYRFIALFALLTLVTAAFPAGAAETMRSISSVRVSESGALGRVEVRKDLAAVLQRDEGIVALVDVADPRRPKVLGRYDDGATQSLDGDLAFSDDGRFIVYARQTVQFSRDGVHVIDISDPTAPSLRSYSPGGGAYRVLTHMDDSGEYVVLLDAVLGLVVYRLVEGVLVPVAVDALPALKVGGPASAGMEIVGDLLYVTTGETGLQIYDFSDPTAPTLLGEWGEEGLAEIEVVKTGKRITAYAATEYWFDPANENEIVVLDVTDAARIRKAARWSYLPALDGMNRLEGMAWSGGVLYAAHSESGLLAFRGGRAVSYLEAGKTCDRTGEEQGCLYGPSAPPAFDVELLGKSLLMSSDDGRLYVVAR